MIKIKKEEKSTTIKFNFNYYNGKEFMKKIIIYDFMTKEDEHHSLIAEIKDNGDLILSGYDSGQSIKQFFGDFDHEY